MKMEDKWAKSTLGMALRSFIPAVVFLGLGIYYTVLPDITRYMLAAGGAGMLIEGIFKLRRAAKTKTAVKPEAAD
jgi:hypothetical protein